MADEMPQPDTRRARLWKAAAIRGIPLRTILVTVAVVAVAFLLGKLVYRLRDVILLIVVAGFVALILNPLVVALQRWRIQRRGWAVAMVTLWGLIVFFGLTVAFGYPLVGAITHLANTLPGYVSKAEHGKGWIGHLVRRYHVQHWVQNNAPKLVDFGKGLAQPALSVGKGAFSLLIALFTIFVLTLLLLLEGPKMRAGLLGMMSPDRAQRYSRVAREVNRSVTGYMLGNFLTSVIAGGVVFVTLLIMGVPFPFLWALWVALVDFLPMIGGALAGIPTVLFAADPLTHGGHRHAGRVPGLHPDREPHPEPDRDEPDGQGQPAARAAVHPDRGGNRKLDRRDLRRVRGGAARYPGRRGDPGAGPRALADHRAAAGRAPAGSGPPADSTEATGPDQPAEPQQQQARQP